MNNKLRGYFKSDVDDATKAYESNMNNIKKLGRSKMIKRGAIGLGLTGLAAGGTYLALRNKNNQ